MSTSISLLGLIEDRIKTGEVALPPLDRIAMDLQNLTEREDFQIDEVLELIQGDQALTSQILKAANSPFYSGLHEITTLRDAVVRLGIAEVVRIAVMVSERKKYNLRAPVLREYVTPLWRHALGCALGSRWLARQLNYQTLENEAFIAGLIHDIGKLLLLKILDEVIDSAEEEITLTEPLALELLDSAHTQEGFNLARTWQLPEAYCEVIRDHHLEEVDPGHTLLLLVRLADRACASLGIGLREDPSIVLSATDEAYSLGAKEILLAQLQIMLEDSRSLHV